MYRGHANDIHWPVFPLLLQVDKFELDLDHRYIPGYGIILQHPDLTGYQQFRHCECTRGRGQGWQQGEGQWGRRLKGYVC